MAINVYMPQWGMTMTEGKIIQWLKNEGEQVTKGEPLFEVETDKIVNEVEAMADGILHQIIRAEGATAQVGELLGILAELGERLERVDTHPAKDPSTVESNRQGIPASKNSAAQTRKAFVKATPSARRLGKELGVDLSAVVATGPKGRVTETDVKTHHEIAADPQKISPLAKKVAEQADLDTSDIIGTGTGGKIVKSDVEKLLSGKNAPAPEPVSAELIPYAGMRRSIGDNMKTSLQTAAQLTSFLEVDVTEMVRFRDSMREAYKKDETVKISFNDIFILAVSRALTKHPRINSTLVGEEIRLHGNVNVGVAVALPEGLIVPVLKRCDQKGLMQIGREARSLAAKARAGTLSPDEVSGGTFTLSNSSMMDVDGFTPILRAPETGILGVGRAKRKPAEYRGEICLRWMMILSLTWNHCVVDGLPAHAFLGTVGKYLENPYLIMS
ncbi:MAG: 2-oxo acid dehydrogenase subunit E2 [Deltaproteobacteria bacterium]|nr:2-oxo acid dehydrogenase subunit E2 [Deltaproteobacteria bacterium]